MLVINFFYKFQLICQSDLVQHFMRWRILKNHNKLIEIY